MLEESGYKDTEYEDHSNNTLNELAHKDLIKTKIKLASTNFNQLNIYH